MDYSSRTTPQSSIGSKRQIWSRVSSRHHGSLALPCRSPMVWRWVSHVMAPCCTLTRFHSGLRKSYEVVSWPYLETSGLFFCMRGVIMIQRTHGMVFFEVHSSYQWVFDWCPCSSWVVTLKLLQLWRLLNTSLHLPVLLIRSPKPLDPAMHAFMAWRRSHQAQLHTLLCR